MQAIGLNPLPSLESHPKVMGVMLTCTDSDLLLFRVLTKTLPDAFLQRVLGTDIFGCTTICATPRLMTGLSVS